VPTDQGTTWYPLIRYIAFIHSLKVEGVSAFKALILLARRQCGIMHMATIYSYHIYFLVARCLCVCTRQVICITKHLQCLLFNTDFDLSCKLDLRTYLQYSRMVLKLQMICSLLLDGGRWRQQIP